MDDATEIPGVGDLAEPARIYWWAVKRIRVEGWPEPEAQRMLVGDRVGTGGEGRGQLMGIG